MENTIKVIDELVRDYWDSCPLRELIIDYGSKFGAHRINKDGSWDSEFKRRIGELGIKPILTSVRHPQTNGKLEKCLIHIRGLEESLSHSRNSSSGITRDLMEL